MVTQARVNLCTQAEAKMRQQASESKLGESGPLRCGLLKGKIQGGFAQETSFSRDFLGQEFPTLGKIVPRFRLHSRIRGFILLACEITR
jgi:hypothetical protein